MAEAIQAMTEYALSLARSLNPETIKAHSEVLPPSPKAKPEKGKRRVSSDLITAAAKEFLAIKNPKRGDIKFVSIKHGISSNSIWHKLSRWKKLGCLDPYWVPPPRNRPPAKKRVLAKKGINPTNTAKEAKAPGN